MASNNGDARDRPQIAFIDAYDSFTNNIACQLTQALNVAVTIIHMDDPCERLGSVLKTFDAVVIGPGPGHPANPEDVGFINEVWELSDEEMIPVLGICLGFQSLCYSEGAEVKKLTRARHGIVSKINHERGDIFAAVEDLEATQYHSLKVDIGNKDGLPVFYEPSEKCPTLRPLAWDVDDEINGQILMGVRHTEKPWWGVQFHPESICTSAAGTQLVKNWWTEAKRWSSEQERKATRQSHWPILPRGLSPPSSGHPTPTGSSNGHRQGSHTNTQQFPLNGTPRGPQDNIRVCRDYQNRTAQMREPTPEDELDKITLHWHMLQAPGVNPTALVEALRESGKEVVLLDSQGHKSGQFSILGLIVPDETMKITYNVTDKTYRHGVSVDNMTTQKLEGIDEVWPKLQDFLDLHEPCHRRTTLGDSEADERDADTRNDRSPFWGGFMGYISYEAGLETIDVESHLSCASGGVPDINFAFISRSIVFDHEKSEVIIQSLLFADDDWVVQMASLVKRLAHGTTLGQPRAQSNGKRRKTEDSNPTAGADLKHSNVLSDALFRADIKRPEEADYRNKVLRCQDFLASGDSYELCLTDETQIEVPRDISNKGLDEWALYKRLRQNNPAPFGAYLNLSGVTVVGSSPERFLRWTRDGHCQFRPIKGTVKKGPDMTREQAHAILESSKERAENLMIVDLIRHDLSGVVGPESTKVPKLMVVEEYETVYQLVSVIEGQLPEKAEGSATGMDVLKKSLPPGSMTGAPKKRSCEILRDIEKRPRGVYSGVLGYMDVGGAGDFSVVIRTAMRNSNAAKMSEAGATNGNVKEEHTSADPEIWRIGAGGAVTIQSTDEGEFQEMEAKQSSVLGSLLRQKK